MNELEQYRQTIDSIDAQLVRLFLERIKKRLKTRNFTSAT